MGSEEQLTNPFLVIIPVYNEERRIKRVIRSLEKAEKSIPDFNYIIIDDGSNDGTTKILGESGAIFVRNRQNRGVGYSIRRGICHALARDYEIICLMAGNGKDNPKDVPKLIRPLLKDSKCVYVQGSRFLRGGSFRNTPFLRMMTIILFNRFWRLVIGSPFIDNSNGFRAMRTRIVSSFDIWHSWLDRYELEYFVHYSIIRSKYKCQEVAVTKIYPSKKDYTKVRIMDWWKIAKISLKMRLGLKP